MRDPNAMLIGGQTDGDKTSEELKREQEDEDRERQEFIDAWKAMYRDNGIDPDTYRVDWNAVFEDERGE